MYSIANKILSLTLCLLLVTTLACDEDFETVNKNPNNPEVVPASLLLPTIIREPVRELNGLAWGTGNIVMQYTAKIQFTSNDRYDWGRSGDPYNTFYNALRDVKNILEITEESGENNYRAVALIMKSWMYSVMTDAYGELPYTEALQAKEGVNLPKFDTQEVVYQGILSELEEANTLLMNQSGEALVGDILFDGDLMLWRKFANSLKMRIYMRLADRQDPSTALQAILSDPETYPIIESNSEQAAFSYLQDSPNQQPVYTTRSGSFDEIRLSENMENTLKGLEDTRLFVYAQPTTDSEAGLLGDWDDYQGVPNGLADEQALQYSPSGNPSQGGSNFISRVGIMFSCRACDGLASPVAQQTLLMSYTELQFILAEARERGFINTGDAEMYYRNGIQASFNYYQDRLAVGGYTELVEAVQVSESYFTQPAVAYTGSQAEKLNKIGQQKWIALFYNGLESWFDWRRTGFPEIQPGADAVISTVPVRFQYPTEVLALNKSAYEEAIQRQGEDKITTRLWVDAE
uniref:SusD/RagB family nutrient-binding outer membrane lipoprotein n=1 Tax=Roseihalotalea indica TaxID=2867963 RepID=A0AA49GQ74_9BACT|nr:SusD/RagB family nutrient-binding outer membrane lipoprotein [Tunicatimonas sp. TK19036]